MLTEATNVDLYEDGTKTASVTNDPSQLTAASLATESSAKNMTVVCSDKTGKVSASGTIMQPGNATAIVLSIDSPSVATGECTL